MAAPGYAANIQAILELVQQFVQESDICQSYSVYKPVTKLLKVDCHWWYVHIVFNESPKWKVNGCEIGWSGWPRIVAATTFSSSWENVWSIPLVLKRGSPILLPNHTVYTQLWKKEVLQLIEVHVTCTGSLDEKELSINLRSA
jgi:hypothetical protein